ISAGRQTPARMPSIKQINRHHNWRKLQTPKEHLMRHQRLLQALGRLGKPKASPEIHGHSRNLKRPDKVPAYAAFNTFASGLGFDAVTCLAENVRPCAPEEDVCEDDEDEESKDLEGEAAEEDVVCWSRVFPVAFCVADECGACHLDG